MNLSSIILVGILSTIMVNIGVWSATTTAGGGTYDGDCSANERLRCRVLEGSCTDGPQADDYPSAPYGLRVSPYLLANPTRKPDSYQLVVNISWMPTHERSINRTIGFEATVLDKDTNRQACFVFQLDEPSWDEKDRYQSVRFRFSTVDMFEYGHNYYVEVQSLPKPLNTTTTNVHTKNNNFISQEVVMPGHPEPQEWAEDTSVDYCSTTKPNPNGAAGAHPHAARWVAAFNYVYIQPKLRSIFVDFIAAPAHYCFEQYELRMLNEKNHIVQQAWIRADAATDDDGGGGSDLYYETHDGIRVAFGNYTFRNVNVGWYEIGVMPVAHSKKHDDRCLCPLPNRLCMCSMSIWPDVEMPDLPPVVAPSNPCDYLPPVKLPFDCPQSSANSNESAPFQQGTASNNGNNGGGALVILICIVIGALIVIAIGSVISLAYYRRYKRKGAGRMYLLPITSTDFDANPNATNTTNTTCRTISTEMTTIFRPVKLTIVYSHDCDEYDRLVRALVEYLDSQCLCDVRVDYRSAADIATNKFDWAYKSILDADRVLLLNSYGSYMRYQAKLVTTTDDADPSDYNDRIPTMTTTASSLSSSTATRTTTTTIVERSEPIQFDDLFLLQLEFLAQECQKYSTVIAAPTTNLIHPAAGGGLLTKKFISVVFPFTPADCLLPHANPYVRYELPKHFRQLMADLHRLPFASDDDAWNAAAAGINDDQNEDSLPSHLKRVNADQYDRCEQGTRLKESLERMTKFIAEQPDWFERLHVRRRANQRRRPNEDTDNAGPSSSTYGISRSTDRHPPLPQHAAPAPPPPETEPPIEDHPSSPLLHNHHRNAATSDHRDAHHQRMAPAVSEHGNTTTSSSPTHRRTGNNNYGPAETSRDSGVVSVTSSSKRRPGDQQHSSSPGSPAKPPRMNGVAVGRDEDCAKQLLIT